MFIAFTERGEISVVKLKQAVKATQMFSQLKRDYKPKSFTFLFIFKNIPGARFIKHQESFYELLFSSYFLT